MSRRARTLTRCRTSAAQPESPVALTRRARRINRELAAIYPDAHCELDFSNPLELSVATILSAQCTDKRVNEVTPAVFAKYPTAADYAARRPRRTRGTDPTDRLLPQQDDLDHQARAGPRRAFRRRGAAHPGGARDAARFRAQDGQCRPGQRVRHPRHHGRHPLRSPGPPVAMDAGDRPRARGVGRQRTDSQEGLDDPVAPGDLARPADVPLPQARLRRMPDRAVVSRRSAKVRPTRRSRRSSCAARRR